MGVRFFIPHASGAEGRDVENSLYHHKRSVLSGHGRAAAAIVNAHPNQWSAFGPRIRNVVMKSKRRKIPVNLDYLSDLNKQQRRAVEHGVEGKSHVAGPLLVIAGAGSGKTKTLAHRVAHLIVNDADPERILLLTFTRRAAEEMGRRVDRITSAAIGTQVKINWSGTFHAIGARLLREYAHAIGLKPNFTILDRSDAEDLMDLVRHDLEFSNTEGRFPKKGTCLKIYSYVVNSQESLDQSLKSKFPYCAEWHDELRKLFKQYVETKQHQNVVDYDDLLLFVSTMLEDDEIAADIGSRFDHILVDEYQDTNRLQAQLLLRLKPDGKGVMVVGDDAQSIYSFRAATVRNILDFPNELKPRARVVTLEQNYRSTQSILDASNAVIGLAKERFTKNLFSERRSKQFPRLVTVQDGTSQARYVADRILQSREQGVSLKSQAVLFRASHHSAELELELTRRNIPFVKYGGLKFLEASHIKDLLGIIRWCENIGDRVAGFRTLKLLPGIGPGTATKCLDRLQEETNPVEILPRLKVPKDAAEEWPRFVTLVSNIRKDGKNWPAELQAIRAWYEPHLMRLYDDPQLRLADIKQLEQIASNFKNRRSFLTELALDPPDATSGRAGAGPRDEEYTILSTIHSAKGQEWKAVRVLNVVDGCIPSDLATSTPEEIEEERRLLYVAMTRAKNDLDLVVPQRFYKSQQAKSGDGHVYANVSRFIPESLRRYFECVSWHDSRNAGFTSSNKATKRLEVAKRAAGMWS